MNDWEIRHTVHPLLEQVGGDHYKNLKIQPLEFVHRNRIPFIEGTVIKYVCRHRAKNGREDIEKAIHLLNILLEMDYTVPPPPRPRPTKEDL